MYYALSLIFPEGRSNLSMSVAHPYAPEADWRIAVSRRFHNEHAEAVYRDVILPVLSQQGIVLECSWAANDVSAGDNFWTRRMRLILDVADIHLLLDIDRSPNMEFEFDMSRRLSRKLKLGGGARGETIRPIGVLVDEREGRSKLSVWKNCAFVHIGVGSDAADAQAKLRAQIENIKLIRIKRIIRLERWSEKLVRPMALRANAPYEDIKAKVVKATNIAIAIRNARTTEDFQAITEFSEVRDSDSLDAQISSPVLRRRLAVSGNRMDEWIIKLRAGQTRLPGGFWDSYREVRRSAEANIVKYGIDEKAVHSFPLRHTLFFLCLVVNMGARRKQSKANSK